MLRGSSGPSPTFPRGNLHFLRQLPLLCLAANMILINNSSSCY